MRLWHALLFTVVLSYPAVAAGLRAGAAQVNINPPKLPVIVNCGFLEKSRGDMNGDLFARSIVLEESGTRIAITVVDSCMMTRELLDQAKAEASAKTGIPVNRMLISATHAHSAPAAMACLGSRQQKDYAEWLPAQIAKAIADASGKLQPAKIGANSIDAPGHTFTRRWIYEPDKMLKDPFGDVSVRANMIPGFENPAVIAPSGPVDSELSVVSIQTADSKPIAVLANFGNHYFGASGISPDYFGIFDKVFAEKIGNASAVVMMSQGTSGDANTSNYAKPKATWTIDEYANGLVNLALAAYKNIQYTAGTPLRMEEALLPLGRRLANAQRLEWAEKTVKAQQGEVPKDQPEVYAHEQIFIRDQPKRELKLQAIRIGDIAITAIPNEVYALTGLKLKAQSPLRHTLNIELANGAEGYIPPPEQHLFGGYTTWAARSAGLETTAEPKIVEQLLTLLEKTAGAKRKTIEARVPTGTKPIAYWPLDDMMHGTAADAMGRYPGFYWGRVAMYSAGREKGEHSAYFAGGTFQAEVPASKSTAYTLSFRFWPGIATNGTGLVRINGSPIPGAPDVTPKTWHEAAIVRKDGKATLYIDGEPKGSVTTPEDAVRTLKIGEGFEGRICNVALYGHAYLPKNASK